MIWKVLESPSAPVHEVHRLGWVSPSLCGHRSDCWWPRTLEHVLPLQVGGLGHVRRLRTTGNGGLWNRCKFFHDILRATKFRQSRGLTLPPVVEMFFKPV